MIHATYWNSATGYAAIQNPADWAEGFDVRDELTGLHGNGTIVELGCGKGRLCGAFHADQYLGLDPCEMAVRHARSIYPEYCFDVYHGQDIMANSCLMYTTLVHVPDDELGPLLDSIHSQTIIIGEICGRDWRRDGDPPVYNREWEEYHRAMLDRGYLPMYHWTKPHARYEHSGRRDTHVHFGVFRGYHDA